MSHELFVNRALHADAPTPEPEPSHGPIAVIEISGANWVADPKEVAGFILVALSLAVMLH